MKIFPAIVLSGALLIAGVAASVSGYSLKSRATAGPETDMAPTRAPAGSTSGGRIFVGPVLHRTDYCADDYVCDEHRVGEQAQNAAQNEKQRAGLAGLGQP